MGRPAAAYDMDRYPRVARAERRQLRPMSGYGKKARSWSVPRQRAPRENFVTGNQDGAKDCPYQEHQQNRRNHLTKPSST
ncbi:MAG TPA: hypothetical protein VJ255_02860, partial [Candidatus Acidoferrum sp.]|nr:hypothetical protein [Candidatus Acidoferrum sp.]